MTSETEDVPSTATATAETAEADTARAQAEARRRRILEKADKRMGVVSGEQTQDEVEKKKSATNAARIRAARQRRYGKKTPAATTAPAPATSALDDTANVQSREPAPAVNVSEDENGGLNAAASATIEIQDEPKKKYVGVAKMRRKMMMKRKVVEEDAAASTIDNGGKSSSEAAGNIPEMLNEKKRLTFPIYMHMLTILLLFVAGFDVGVQQVQPQVVVHQQTAVKEFGIPLIHRNLSAQKGHLEGKKSGVGSLNRLEVESAFGEQDGFEDEFQEAPETTYEPNIDPLFRVDLDELTKGPGLFNQIARGAIAVHRLFLRLVYYMPLSFVEAMVSLPMTLIQRPPVLCLVALAIRQIVGNAILGARIPEVESQEKDSAIDVLSMIKQTITKFLSANFPTAVGAYDAFSHLRSDIYIVISGVLCGICLVYTSGIASESPQESNMGLDEVPVEKIPVGIAGEL